MKRPTLTPDELNNTLTTYHDDDYLACSMLRQSADEIDVAVYALMHGDDSETVHSLLMGIAQRMRLAAKFADADEDPVVSP